VSDILRVSGSLRCPFVFNFLFSLNVADFPHGVAPCGFNLSLTIRRHAVRSPGEHAVTLQPSWHHRVIEVRPTGALDMVAMADDRVTTP
jgi:hypothetical protein